MAATNSYSKATSSQSATNQQVGAGTGGAAIGANSSGNIINVTNTDLDVVKSAMETVGGVASGAFHTADNALAINRDISQQAISGIVKVTGRAGSILQSSFGQFTTALTDINRQGLTVQNNATQAALNVIANAAPQTQAALTEHLAGSSVLPGMQSIDAAGRDEHITVTEILVVVAIVAAAYFIFTSNK